MKNENKKLAYRNISRRSFLKGALAAGTVLALSGCNNEPAVKTVTVTENFTNTVTETVTNTVTVTETELTHMPDSQKIVLDNNKCTACLSCELACSAAHFGVYSNTLAAIRIQADFRNRKYLAFVCQQCLSASCVAACPDKVNAILFDEKTGARYVDMEKCTACGKCIEACPFQDTPYPLIKEVDFEDIPYIVKCDLCHGKENGPSCIAACPNSALTLED